MKKIEDYTADELSAKIEAIKAERERTANALNRYEEELERRKQEVPLGVPAVGKFCLTYDGRVDKFINNRQEPEDYNFNIFPSEESAKKHAKMLKEWRRDGLVANAKGEPIDIKVLLPLLVKGYVFYDPSNNFWIYCINKPIKTSNGWLISGGFNSIDGFNIKPAEDWQNSLMECGL